ncbi:MULTISPECIES: hypothetical protein [unclassified Sphingobium]|uniref:hypothetical protein n=1 Tax=unclassified Sphingobium TaxID=2611147 RepID=UPI0035A6F5FB
MQRISSSVRHKIRLIAGGWIVAAGLAIVATLLCLRVTGTPLGPAMLSLAIFGIGPALLLAGALIMNALAFTPHTTPSHPH